MDVDCSRDHHATLSKETTSQQNGEVHDNLPCGPVAGGGGYEESDSAHSTYQGQVHNSWDSTEDEDIDNGDGEKAGERKQQQCLWPLLSFSTRKAGYPLIARIAPFLRWKLSVSKNADIAWMDVWTAMDLQKVESKINHFSGMYQICAKCSLGRHLTRMKKVNSSEFSFFPPTFVLPADRASLQRYLENGDVTGNAPKSPVAPKRNPVTLARTNEQSASTEVSSRSTKQEDVLRNSVGESDGHAQDEAEEECCSTPASKDSNGEGVFFPQGESSCASAENSQKPRRRRKVPKHVFISKPDSSSQGNGIQLVTNPSRLLSYGTTLDSVDKPSKLIQKYIDNPLLIGGHKFDLRLYACVSAVQPEPRVFLLKEGLARFATKPYRRPTMKNSKNRMMHLTNYAVNKGQELHLNLQSDCDRNFERESPSCVTESTASVGNESSPVPDADENGEAEGDGDAEVDEQLSRLFEEALSNQLRSSNGVTIDPFAGFRNHPVLMSTDECGSGGPKWSLSAVMSVLREQHGIDVDQLWSETCDVVSKTVASIAPTLRHHYAAATAGSRRRGDKVAENRKNGCVSEKDGQKGYDADAEGFMCFEVLGFDIMFSRDRASKCVKPQLIEVNQSPSFHSDSVLDAIVKLLSVGDALRLGAASEHWLRSSFAPMLSRLTSAGQRVHNYSVKELRTLYENVICYGDVSKIFQNRDQTRQYSSDCRYARLMPSDDPRKQSQFEYLMEQASYASGSVLQGGSESLNRRREEALERRKQLAKEQSLKLPKVHGRSRSHSHRQIHSSASKSSLDTSHSGDHPSTCLRSSSCRTLPTDSSKRGMNGVDTAASYPKDDTDTVAPQKNEKPPRTAYRPPKSAAFNQRTRSEKQQQKVEDSGQRQASSEAKWAVATPSANESLHAESSHADYSMEPLTMARTSYSSMLSGSRSFAPDPLNFRFCSHDDQSYRRTYAKDKKKVATSNDTPKPLEISGCALKPSGSSK